MSASESVDNTTLWKVLQSRDVPDFLLKLLEALHSHTAASVSIGSKLSKRLIITSSVQQGCLLALVFFNVAINKILSHVTPSVGISVGPCRFTDLAYDDDAAVFLSDEAQARKALQNLGTGPQSSAELHCCCCTFQPQCVLSKNRTTEPQLGCTGEDRDHQRHPSGRSEGLPLPCSKQEF